MTIGDAFGATADGQTVHRVKIEGGGLTAHVMTWGAVVQDLRLAGHAPPLVLGFESFEDYPRYSPHFGAVPGRCANRIANGRFVLDGKTWQVDQNFLGKHHLHGGSKGFGKRVWEFIDSGRDFVTLRIVAGDGEMGIRATSRSIAPTDSRTADRWPSASKRRPTRRRSAISRSTATSTSTTAARPTSLTIRFRYRPMLICPSTTR